MKKLFTSRKVRITVDILLVTGLIVAAICSGLQDDYTPLWTSPHCVSSGIWCLLIVIHIVQHWKMIRAFTKKKVIIKNKITALTILSAILMGLSVIVFVCKVDFHSLHFHGIIGRLFVLMVIVHMVDKCRKRNRKK